MSPERSVTYVSVRSELEELLAEARDQIVGSAHETVEIMTRAQMKKTGGTFAQAYAQVLSDEPELDNTLNRDGYSVTAGTRSMSGMVSYSDTLKRGRRHQVKKSK
jgi:hypothetical protein